MRCLFMDTSSFFINVAIVEDNKILHSHFEEIKKDMSSRIIPLIEDCFNNVNFNIDDIDKLFVVNGPGSFTGVRVGVTVAKTICWSLKKDLIPLSSLEVIASTPSNKKYNVGLIDARRGNVFAGIYDKELNNILSDCFISMSDLEKKIDDNYELIGINHLTIKPDIIKVINKHINDESINPHLLKPNYLKLTEAEEKLNDQRNN